MQYALACSGSHATAAIDKMMLTILGFMVESDAAAIAPSGRSSHCFEIRIADHRVIHAFRSFSPGSGGALSTEVGYSFPDSFPVPVRALSRMAGIRKVAARLPMVGFGRSETVNFGPTRASIPGRVGPGSERCKPTLTGHS
jgi:hypothetical protein